MSLSISEDGELQVQGYLRFAKLKRDQHVREVVSTVTEFKQEHIRQGVWPCTSQQFACESDRRHMPCLSCVGNV